MDMQSSQMMLEESRRLFKDKEMQHYFANFSSSYTRTLDILEIKSPKDLPEDAEAHGKFWQIFWENLPDAPYIRGPQFNLVCDLAEWYCFGDR